MQAIILAAGMGKRLGELTSENTKCMIEVNGVTLIERALRQLDSLSPSLTRIVIVIGFQGEKLKSYIESLDITTPLQYIENADYATTNNIASLALAKDILIEQDTLLLESDLIFEDAVLNSVIKDERPTLALVDKYESWMDGTVTKIDAEDNILAFIPGKKFVFEDIPDYYKTVNIYKFSKEFSQNQYVPFLEAYQKAYGKNEYYEQVLRILSMVDGAQVKARRLDGEMWYEIDDIQDLDIASSLFNITPEDRFLKTQKRRGGYWRYPKLLDFSNTNNYFYPPQRLRDEIRANFEKIVSQTPSSVAVSSLLAAKNYGINQAWIVAGNSAGNLIAPLFQSPDLRVAVLNVQEKDYLKGAGITESAIAISPKALTTIDEIISWLQEIPVSAFFLSNPCSLTGKSFKSEELFTLATWLKEHDITFVLDETLVDFTEDGKESCLENTILEQHPQLFVLKSISTCSGISGLNLTILASSDEQAVANIKDNLPLQNINSFGEFYLQIAEKYKADYTQSVTELKKERVWLCDELSHINNISLVSAPANFIILELAPEYNTTKLASALLTEFNILVKDLSLEDARCKQRIRISIRNHPENEILVAALKNILGTQSI